MKAKNAKSKALRFFTYACSVFSAFVVVFIIVYISINGIRHLTPSLFALKYNSTNVSLLPSLINTLLMLALTLFFSVPIGIMAAIYSTEYAKKGSRVVNLIRMAAETLSGIPSIVYGLFGLLFFVTRLSFRLSLLSGALTLAIMVLPSIFRTGEEALISVPQAYREASFALGAGKLYTIFRTVLPSAVPGILSGIILASGRIIGETAALLYTAGSVPEVPSSVFDSVRTLSVHMYALSSEGLYLDKAFSTGFVLVVIVLLVNSLSFYIAKKVGVKHE
jgi:phosphate ABC transporter, permease protein PstA